jgi:hypothetical protein
MTSEIELRQVDRDALTLAIEVTKRESPARRRQVDDFLSSPQWIRPWIEVATFAAGCAQARSLNLPPWQPAPCNVGNMEAALADQDEVRGYRAAALLRQRMQRLGVSRWHPDPARECHRVEASSATQRRHSS